VGEVLWYRNGSDWKTKPDPDLLVQIQEIVLEEAREEALSILEDQWEEVSGDYGPDRIKLMGSHGLNSAAIACLKFMKEPEGEAKGFGALGRELKELAAAMKEVAGRLRTLSPTATDFIERLTYDSACGDLQNAQVMQRWIDCRAGEAFPVREFKEFRDLRACCALPRPAQPVLAMRLEGMIEILGFLEAQSQEEMDKAPGARRVLAPPPPDFGIMDACAEVLAARGKTMTYLRPIAEAVYRWGLNKNPSDHWAQRQENAAREKGNRIRKSGGPWPPLGFR
jgi:hypothetical protein